MKSLTKALLLLEGACTIAGMACVVLMMLHVTADVAGRYFLGKPLPGTITVVSSYYMVALSFLPLMITEKMNAHISVDIIFRRFPAWARHGLVSLNYLFVTVVLAFATVRSWQVAAGKTEIRAAVQQGVEMTPVWPSYWLLPVGLGLMGGLCAVRFGVSLINPGQIEHESANSEAVYE